MAWYQVAMLHEKSSATSRAKPFFLIHPTTYFPSDSSLLDFRAFWGIGQGPPTVERRKHKVGIRQNLKISVTK